MRVSPLLVSLLIALPVSVPAANQWLTRPATLRTSAKDFVPYPPAEALAKHEMEVAFFCDVSKEGKPSDFLLYRPSDTSNAFVVAVRKALNAASFEPAVSQGVSVIVQLAATVSFEIRNGQPTTLMRLNISDKSASERDYTGPQLIGGRSALLQSVGYPSIARARHANGLADVAFEIDTFGNPRGVHVVNEEPTAHGFGDSAAVAVRKARFIPAFYQNQALKAPATQRVEFNYEVIDRYGPKKY